MDALAAVARYLGARTPEGRRLRVECDGGSMCAGLECRHHAPQLRKLHRRGDRHVRAQLAAALHREAQRDKAARRAHLISLGIEPKVNGWST